MKEGVIQTGYMWNPMEAGEAIVTLAKMLIDGKEITDGMEIPGLGKVAVDKGDPRDQSRQNATNHQRHHR